MQIRDFDIETFLRDHWQRQPLLIRNPWADWKNPLSGDELAGLACEEEVESRLIENRDGNWSLEHGPISPERYETIGEHDWTLLVQAVDHYIPAVAALIEPFRFIPDWRIDDVMVSYAADGGGVGPHFDQYDVFLIQGSGKRRWRLGGQCDENTKLLPHDELSLLADFRMEQEYLCEPGDILYVPPGFAHEGSAVGADCMTYSVGFRAPSRRELLGHWIDELVSDMRDERYRDQVDEIPLPGTGNPGEISAAELDRLHAMVLSAVNDRHAFARWFGRYSSMPKYPAEEEALNAQPDSSALSALLAGDSNLALYRNPASRFVFVQGDADSIILFVDGKSFECHKTCRSFAEQLCQAGTRQIELPTELSDETGLLIKKLLAQHSLLIEKDED